MRKVLALLGLVSSLAFAAVNASYSPTTYTGNGSTTVFAVPWKFMSSADLTVTLTVSGVTTTKALTADYTVSGAGVDTGGSVTMLSAPANGSTLTITRTTPLTQPTSFKMQGSFSPALHEKAFDRTELQQQELVYRMNVVEDGGHVLAGGTVTALPYWSTSTTLGNTSLTYDAGTLAIINAGPIQSLDGGFIFPDGTTQVTAATSGTLPSDTGKNGQFLTTNGSGVTSWAPALVLHSSLSTAPQAMEYGSKILSAGVGAVTFATSFSSTPACVCSNASNAADGCKVAITNTTLNLSSSGATDVIVYMCAGPK